MKERLDRAVKDELIAEFFFVFCCANSNCCLNSSFCCCIISIFCFKISSFCTLVQSWRFLQLSFASLNLFCLRTFSADNRQRAPHVTIVYLQLQIMHPCTKKSLVSHLPISTFVALRSTSTLHWGTHTTNSSCMISTR